jgi:hypothetical protein
MQLSKGAHAKEVGVALGDQLSKTMRECIPYPPHVVVLHLSHHLELSAHSISIAHSAHLTLMKYCTHQDHQDVVPRDRPLGYLGWAGPPRRLPYLNNEGPHADRHSLSPTSVGAVALPRR